MGRGGYCSCVSVLWYGLLRGLFKKVLKIRVKRVKIAKYTLILTNCSLAFNRWKLFLQSKSERHDFVLRQNMWIGNYMKLARTKTNF